jgi:hypothetical protein
MPDNLEQSPPGASSPGLRKSGLSAVSPSGQGAREARRVLALVLPELLVELAQQSTARAQLPLAVVLSADQPQPKGGERLAAVDAAAQRLGLYRGQSARAAARIVPELDLQRLTVPRVASALAGLVDVLRGFGHGYSCAFPDTLWLDVTQGVTTHSGEHALGLELVGKLAKLGHYCRVAFANGPLLAQAFARHADIDGTGVLVVPSTDVAQALGQLPVLALPMTPEQNVRCARAGILTLGELREHATSAELPAAFRRLLQAQDDTPLQELAADDTPHEELLWDPPLCLTAAGPRSPAGVASAFDSALATVCRRLGARLEGRGRAAAQLLLTLGLLRGGDRAREQLVAVRLGVPTSQADEIERALCRKLSKLDAQEKLCRLELQVERERVDEAVQQRLPLELAGIAAPAPAGVVARVAEELSSRLGPGTVGRFAQAGKRARTPGKLRDAREAQLAELPSERRFALLAPSALPNRVLPAPIEVHGRIERGQLVFLGSDVFMIVEGHLEADGSTRAAKSEQEYLRLWLVALRSVSAVPNLPSDTHGVEVLARHDRRTRRVYVEGYYD